MASINNPGKILKLWKKAQERYGVSEPDKDAKKKVSDKDKAAAKQSEKITKGLLSLKQVTAGSVKTPSEIKKFEATRDRVVLVMKKYCQAIKSAKLEGAQDMNKLRKTAKQLTVVVAALNYLQLSNEEGGDADLGDIAGVDTMAFDKAMEDPNFAVGAEDESEANEVEDTEAGSEPEVKPPIPPPTTTPPPTPPPSSGQAEFLARLKTLMPAVQQAQAAGTETSKIIVQRMAEANAFARNKDFAQASQALDKLELLLAAPTAPPPPPDGNEVMKRLNNLLAAVKVALAGPNAAPVQSLFLQSNAAIKSKDFVQASKSLDDLEKLLKSATQPRVATLDKERLKTLTDKAGKLARAPRPNAPPKAQATTRLFNSIAEKPAPPNPEDAPAHVASFLPGFLLSVESERPVASQPLAVGQPVSGPDLMLGIADLFAAAQRSMIEWERILDGAESTEGSLDTIEEQAEERNEKAYTATLSAYETRRSDSIAAETRALQSMAELQAKFNSLSESQQTAALQEASNA